MDNDRIEVNIRNQSGRFVKGYKYASLPQEIKDKRRQSSIASWKNRNNYIGDIRNENPYIYNSWRGIMFSKKGGKQNVNERWHNFRVFYNDVSPTYKKGLIFRRKDVNQPFDIDNFMWCTTEEAGNMKKNTIYLEYDGEYLSLKQLADKYNQSYAAVQVRYHHRKKRKYTLEEIIFGRKKKRGSKVVKDYRSDVSKLRAKASKMISAYKVKDYKNGCNICDIDIDWMIDNILKKKCVYCGDDFRVGCDRIDNNKGHTKDNVVPCCIECNTARNNNFSFEEMKILGQTIAKIKKDRKKENI